MTRTEIILAALLLAATGAVSAQPADAPPTTPGNFRATLYDKAGGELFWQRSSDDRGAVRGYEITKNGQNLGIRDALSFYDRSLLPGVPYTFTVAAIDSAGQRSTISTTTLGGGATTPSPSGDGPVAPRTLRADVYSKRSAELFWQREPAALALRYEIRRDGQVVGTTNGVSYFTRDLAAGTDYAFEVIAIDRQGRRSDTSSVTVRTEREISPPVASGPPAPMPADLRAEIYSKRSAELFWKRERVQLGLSYEIRRDGRVVGTTDGVSYYTRDLAAGTDYTFEVVAVAPNGDRSSASSLTVRTDGDGASPPPTASGPAAPENLRSERYSARSGELFWQREPAVQRLRYEVRRDGAVLATTDGVSYYDDTLTAGRSYDYEVIAIDRQDERSTASTVTLATSGGDGGDNPSVPDPVAENLVRVDVEITVPAHVSNALSVELTWGTKRIMAEWLGDEQWRATVDFPKVERPSIGIPENDYLLAINFRDRNGDIMLGRTEAFYSVREGSAETYTVIADDFDTERWDDDSDGASNLDELRRGTDPLVADTPVPPESLEALESLFLTRALERGATYFEPSFLELELPVDDRTEVVDGFATTITEADFSADGNGTFRERYSFDIDFDRDAYREERGTRSREGNSVTWSGVRWSEGSSLAVREETTFDITSTLDGNELSQRGEGFVTSDAFSGKLDFVSYRYDVVLDLDSRDADDTCTALRGSILSVIKYQGDQGTNPFESTRAVSRHSADERWRWSGVDNDGTRVAGEANRVSNRFYCGFRFEP